MQGYNYVTKSSNDDQILWTALIQGDKNALGELFTLYVKELLTYGYRICGNSSLTKDAIQDVFVDLWLYRSNLSPKVQVKFYLYRCVRRALIKQLPGEQFAQGDFADMEHLTDHQSSPETEWVLHEDQNLQNNRIFKSLNLLSEREREVISLKYYSDMKIREIASLLELKEQTVANTLQNALIKLRKHLVYLVVLLQQLVDKFL